jgi:hypothetical protein
MTTTTAARALIAPFYDALTRPASKDVRALVEGLASPDWRSFSGEGVSKGREEFIQQVMGFGKLIPTSPGRSKRSSPTAITSSCAAKRAGRRPAISWACPTAASASR